jgi:DNA-binding CsgD family transcriptional regulator
LVNGRRDRQSMTRNLLKLSRRYQAALRAHLRQDPGDNAESMRGLGSEALAAGLEMPELARIHEQTVVKEMAAGDSVGKRAALFQRAGIFFSAAMTPIEEAPRNGREAAVDLQKLVGALSLRTLELAASNRDLNVEIGRRKATEKEFRKRERRPGPWPGRPDRLDEMNGLLTSRETEVLQLVAESKPNKGIAAELGISIKTVEKHRGHLMEKLDIHDTAGLTRYAIGAGIIESSFHVRFV